MCFWSDVSFPFILSDSFEAGPGDCIRAGHPFCPADPKNLSSGSRFAGPK
jgi:hypothetical protein